MHLLPLFLLYTACSDYEVSHDTLEADIESPELPVEADGDLTVGFRCETDQDALDARPSSRLSLSVFAVDTEGVPTLTIDAFGDSADGVVAGPTYINLTVSQPFARCLDPDAEGPTPTWAADRCAVVVTAALGAVGGSVSAQIAAHLQLDFGQRDAPGTLSLTLE